MAEQRLIDANLLLKEAEESLCENPHTGVMAQAMHTHEHRHFMCMILHQTTIDPETLTIVQQLQEELKRVTAERDAAVKDIEQAITIYRDVEGWDILCRFCKGKSCRNGGDCKPEWRGGREVVNNE